MMRRLLFEPLPWVALLLLVASSASAQEPVKADRLFEAVKANNISAVKDALEAGAEVNARNKVRETPLIYAARYSSTPEIVSLLIENGAEIEARDELFAWTPLIFAASNSSTPEIVSVLLEKGANALAKDKSGFKAIDYAKGNEKLKGTPAYWTLHTKSFE